MWQSMYYGYVLCLAEGHRAHTVYMMKHVPDPLRIKTLHISSLTVSA